MKYVGETFMLGSPGCASSRGGNVALNFCPVPEAIYSRNDTRTNNRPSSERSDFVEPLPSSRSIEGVREMRVTVPYGKMITDKFLIPTINLPCLPFRLPHLRLVRVPSSRKLTRRVLRLSHMWPTGTCRHQSGNTGPASGSHSSPQ